MTASKVLNGILDSATHTAIVVTDFDGKIILFNQGAANLFGYTPEEAKDRKLPELTFSKDDQNARLFERIVDRAKSKGWTEERLFRQYKSGRLFQAISTITCLKDSTGQCEGILEITQDVPDLYRLERELKSSKDFLENILASSIDAVVTTDIKGHITYVNRAFKELIGLPGHQIIGKHISLYYKDGIDQARRIMDKLRQFGRIRDYEFDMKVGDKIIPIRTSDRLENQAEEDPGLRKRVMLLKECNRRIEKIVKKLKEFSRHAEFEFTAMDVNDAVSSVLAITQQQLLNQGIEVELRLRENLPLVLGDINQIEQVLLNLMSNARDAMEGSSQKVLAMKTGLSQKGQQVEIEVSDTGTGMTAEQIEQIFNPFFTTKESDKSIGLGLSISYRIVEDHQGKIEVKSALNKGTTFIVSLPIYLAGAEGNDASK